MSDLSIAPILPIWQKVGSSTHEIARHIAEKYQVKTSHTGTLDPLAEGVVIVLLGDERLKKYEYAFWPKTYTFDIVFGFQTDTYDGMGLITDSKLTSAVVESSLQSVLSTFIGSYKQQVPLYSTKKIAGKHLHEYARLGIPVEQPIKTGEIYSITLNNLHEHKLENIINPLLLNIEKVTGDFRQLQIVHQWQSILHSNTVSIFQVASITVKMSKGLYVRSLSQDICAKLNTCGFANTIVRIANGGYTKMDCVC